MRYGNPDVDKLRALFTELQFTRFLDMLDAQRGLFDARGALVDTLVDYHVALAEIERMIGSSIEGLEKLSREDKK